METVEGYLNKIIFHNKENNYYILSIFLNDNYDFVDGDYLSIVGTFDDIDFIEDDELLEVTPQNLRLRKRYLDSNERKRMAKSTK